MKPPSSNYCAYKKETNPCSNSSQLHLSTRIRFPIPLKSKHTNKSHAHCHTKTLLASLLTYSNCWWWWCWWWWWWSYCWCWWWWCLAILRTKIAFLLHFRCMSSSKFNLVSFHEHAQTVTQPIMKTLLFVLLAVTT